MTNDIKSFSCKHFPVPNDITPWFFISQWYFPCESWLVLFFWVLEILQVTRFYVISVVWVAKFPSVQMNFGMFFVHHIETPYSL